MKLKKKYVHNNNRQIFRLIPTDNDKLIVEERNIDKKQAYFNCLDINKGKKIFKGLQFDEKFWIGIETVYNEVILFHKFRKPDMPHHRGILAFDIKSKKIIWEDVDNTFLFIKDDKVYAFQQQFEQREYFVLDFYTGKIVNELGNNSDSINILREEVNKAESFSSYHFPITYGTVNNIDQRAVAVMQKLRENHVIKAKIEYVLKEHLLMFNFHQIGSDNSLNNSFKAVDLSNGKYILEKVLNLRTNAFAPDSFFLKDNILFLLVERTKLEVYTITN
jgi:Domain of unknown function (DUF4905)